MSDNPNTHFENAQLDAEDWEIAFQPYVDNPGASLSLGFLLMILRGYLVLNPPQIQVVIQALDLAMDVLFPFTQFHKVSYVLFRRLSEGKLSRDEEKILEALGIKF